jgi:hypothetical protein
MGTQLSQPGTKEVQSQTESNNRYYALCAIAPMALHGQSISHQDAFAKDA